MGGSRSNPLVTTARPGSHVLEVARSEWFKLRTLRSTTWILGTTALLVVGIGGLESGFAASQWGTAAGAAERPLFDPTVTSLLGLLVGQLAIGVLGVLVVSAEHASGMIRSTLAAVPRRGAVLAAKAVVFTAVALVVGECSSFAAFGLGQWLLAGRAPHATLANVVALRSVVGGGLYLAVLGLLALGIATVIRHTAGSISAYVSILFVLPLIVQVLPASIENAIDRFVPANIWAVLVAVRPGRQVSFGTPGSGVPTATLFGPWEGFAVLCAYATVTLAVGAWLFTRRDP